MEQNKKLEAFLALAEIGEKSEVLENINSDIERLKKEKQNVKIEILNAYLDYAKTGGLSLITPEALREYLNDIL